MIFLGVTFRPENSPRLHASQNALRTCFCVVTFHLRMSLSHPLNLYHLSLNNPVTCPDVKPIPSLKVLSKILHTLHYLWIVLLDFDIRFHCCSHCFLLALTGGKAALVASSRHAG